MSTSAVGPASRDGRCKADNPTAALLHYCSPMCRSARGTYLALAATRIHRHAHHHGTRNAIRVRNRHLFHDGARNLYGVLLADPLADADFVRLNTLFLD